MSDPQTYQVQLDPIKLRELMKKIYVVLRNQPTAMREAALVHMYSFVSNGALSWRDRDEEQRRALFFRRAATALAELVVDVARMEPAQVQQEFAAAFPEAARKLQEQVRKL